MSEALVCRESCSGDRTVNHLLKLSTCLSSSSTCSQLTFPELMVTRNSSASVHFTALNPPIEIQEGM